MLRFHTRLSPRQKYWLGLVCCPFVAGLPAGVIILLNSQFNLHWNIPARLVPAALIFFGLSALVISATIPLISGFFAAFFWRNLIPIPSQEMMGLKSVLFTWLPVLFFGSFHWFLVVYFVAFISLYCVASAYGKVINSGIRIVLASGWAIFRISRELALKLNASSHAP
ncbi:hypothetical protein EON83_18730 [bacterium]|nr:MAG: hypothetical protein EON83_18730 [bacterium]